MHQAFWQDMHARIAKYDLLCHPFYQAWTSGELTREDLRAYAGAYYQHVAAFPEYLEALHNRLPEGAMASAVLQNLEDENGVDSPDGRPHADLWLDFAEGMGATRSEAASSAAPAEVSGLIAYFRRVAQAGSTAEALAAFYAYESQVPRVAREKARGLKQMYGADARTCGYFTLHMTADVHHAGVWREQLEKHFQVTSFEFRDKALNAAENSARALWRALDGIERQRLARAAA